MRAQSVLLLSGALLAYACAPRSSGTLDADLASIQAVDDAITRAVAAGDVEGYLSHFTDSATVLVPNGPNVRGKDALRAWVGPIFAANNVQVTLTALDRQVSGDWAFEVVRYQLHLTPKTGGPAIEDRGKELIVLRREAGTWRVYTYAYSSDLPAQPPQLSPPRPGA